MQELGEFVAAAERLFACGRPRETDDDRPIEKDAPLSAVVWRGRQSDRHLWTSGEVQSKDDAGSAGEADGQP
ncbi:MAG: hypothetical protein ABL982_00905 [Vicinamibacterales bacterium]